MGKTQIMENEYNKPYEEIDWDDDSGEIHTYKEKYHLTKEDGWQPNRAYRGLGLSKQGKKNRMIKGTQIGTTYVTDDYRKVIPVQIISTIIVIVLCIVVTKLILPVGILFDIMGVAWVIGIWKRAPYKKWKNQANKRKEDSKNDWLR